MSETAGRDDRLLALMIQTPDEPGILHELTRVILEHRANITYVDIAERRGLSLLVTLADFPESDLWNRATIAGAIANRYAGRSVIASPPRRPRG